MNSFNTKWKMIKKWHDSIYNLIIYKNIDDFLYGIYAGTNYSNKQGLFLFGFWLKPKSKFWRKPKFWGNPKSEK